MPLLMTGFTFDISLACSSLEPLQHLFKLYVLHLKLALQLPLNTLMSSSRLIVSSDAVRPPGNVCAITAAVSVLVSRLPRLRPVISAPGSGLAASCAAVTAVSVSSDDGDPSTGATSAPKPLDIVVFACSFFQRRRVCIDLIGLVLTGQFCTCRSIHGVPGLLGRCFAPNGNDQHIRLQVAGRGAAGIHSRIYQRNGPG